MKEITEILKTEGIMSQGFGISPKILYRDKRLTPEAKAIYGYIASFAGNGSTAFPSRDIMLEELGMSVKRYYKHFALLQQCGYIDVTKQRDKFGSFDRNIYTLVSNPIAKKDLNTANTDQSESRSVAVKKTDSTASKPERKPVRRSSTTCTKLENSIQRGNWLRESMAIEEITHQQPEDKILLERIYMAALDMENSEQIKIGGAIRNRQQIMTILHSLDADTTRTVIFKYKKILKNKEYKIRNVRAFLQTLICNSPFEIDDLLIHQEAQHQQAEDVKKQEDNEAVRKQRDRIMEEHPKLRRLESDYTNVMRSLTRIMLTDDAEEKARLMKRRDEIDTQRRTYLEEYGLPEIM